MTLRTKRAGSRRRRGGRVAAALTVGLSAPSGATPVASHRGGGDHVRLDRAFIIVLENHSANSVIGDPNTPFITSLARQYGEAANYFGVTHPSEPNYVAMISGSNWDTNNDNPANRFDHTNVVDARGGPHRLGCLHGGAAGRPLDDFWPRAPTRSMRPSTTRSRCSPTSSPTRPGGDIKPYTALAGDLNSGHAPRFVFITPDQCNDMHGGVTASPGHTETPCPYNSTNDDPNDVGSSRTQTPSSRARWPRSCPAGPGRGTAPSSSWPTRATSPATQSTAAGTPRPAAATPPSCRPATRTSAPLAGRPLWRRPGARDRDRPEGPRHFVSNVAYNHYSLLRTIEDAWGLPELAFTSDHAQVPMMNEFLGH